MDTFFSHENQPYPPSLSSNGKLRQGKKSDLLKCLERLHQNSSLNRPITDVTIIDGAALVNILKALGCKTFSDYIVNILAPYINTEFTHTCRIDIVWDQYHENSLKSQTREIGSIGPTLRRKVEMMTPIPAKWHDFLRVDENKKELFNLISTELMNFVTS